MTDIIIDQNDGGSNPENTVENEWRRLSEIYLTFLRTTKTTEKATLLTVAHHDNILIINEEREVRLFLEFNNLIECNSPPYYEIDFEEVRISEAMRAHNRVIAQGITPGDVKFTIASCILIDDEHGTATETLFLNPGTIASDDAEKLSDYQQNWDRLNGIVDEDSPFTVDPKLARVADYARGLKLPGRKFLDLRDEES